MLSIPIWRCVGCICCFRFSLLGYSCLRGVLKTLNSIEKIQPRMLAATFNGNPKATIISCYSPTNVSEETELVAFYDKLSSLVRSIPKHIYLIFIKHIQPSIPLCWETFLARFMEEKDIGRYKRFCLFLQ